MSTGYNQGAIMDASNAVYGSLATCFVTLNGQRLKFLNFTEFHSKWEINIVEVPILGKVGFGHKAAGGKGTWTAKAHYNQSDFRVVMDTFQKTGVMPYFEVQVTNEDPTTTVGRQTVIHKKCLFDAVTLAMFAAGEDIMEEDLSGTFEEWDMPEKFTALSGM